MKRIQIIVLLLIVSTLTGAQEVTSSKNGNPVYNKAYFGLGLDWQSGMGGGSIFSIAPEYGKNLSPNVSVGITARLIWYTGKEGCRSLGFHPYLRLSTSLPSVLPNFFVDIGYDIRRVTYDGGDRASSYHHDFGLRPGIIINVAGWFHLFVQFNFSGYQWAVEEEVSTNSWTLFRHEGQDRCAGLLFYF